MKTAETDYFNRKHNFGISPGFLERVLHFCIKPRVSFARVIPPRGWKKRDLANVLNKLLAASRGKDGARVYNN